MNVVGNSNQTENGNVLPLFSNIELTTPAVDPLRDLILESETELAATPARRAPKAKRILVTENQFPDQSIYVLEQQLANLNKSLSRLKFYLGDLDDLLPR